MNEAVFTGLVANPQEVLPDASLLRNSFVLLERDCSSFQEQKEFQGICLLEYAGIDFGIWAQGCLFNKQFELRWERRGEAFYLVFVGDPALSPPALGGAAMELQPCHDVLKHYLLWGERMDYSQDLNAELPDPIYLEVKVPRLFHYPVAGTQRRVSLVVREFYCRETGILRYSRFYGLEETT